MKRILSVLFVLVLVLSFGFSAYADNSYSFSVGQSVNTTVFSASGNQTITGCDYSVPAGLSVSQSGSSVLLSGCPNANGSGYINVTYSDGSGEYLYPISITVGSGGSGMMVDNGVIVNDSATGNKTNKINVTKSPTGESVNKGDSAVFVAKAENATNITWYIVSPATGNRYPASEVGQHFAGVTANGYGTERLVLNNISRDMNGWSVMAQFTNGTNDEWSSGAPLTVNDVEVVETPSPSPSETPTPSPTPSPTPTPANGTTTYVNGTPVQNGISSGLGTTGNSNTTAIGNGNNVSEPSSNSDNYVGTATTASAGTRSGNHTGAYVLAGLAGLVIVGAVTTMALYMKGKISLGKFEQFLGGKDSEGFDSSDDFYNPDDFRDDK